jgi:2-polyprenyl-3-methyl-5-hydroxy-6-metoxy-1,4-benzoquinol methylase
MFDENIVCPLTGENIVLADGRLVTTSGRRYEITDDIPLLFVDEPDRASTLAGPHIPPQGEVTHTVQDFYENAPFPNYNSFDNLAAFIRQADSGMGRLLRKQIPLNASVLEVGCGTAQLSNYLAATTLSRVYASDMTLPSLRLGHNFALRNNIDGVGFVQMNLFMPAIRAQSMDIVISNGVLHHTYDTRKAFACVSRLVKPGGYVVLGLYNWIGRKRTDLRRWLLKQFGDNVLALDPQLRRIVSPEKRRAWINDQYYHPQEREHSLSEVIRWFDEEGFSFVSSIPKIVGSFSEDENLFVPRDSGSPLERVLAEIGMLTSTAGGEGGLFVCLGRRHL